MHAFIYSGLTEFFYLRLAGTKPLLRLEVLVHLGRSG